MRNYNLPTDRLRANDKDQEELAPELAGVAAELKKELAGRLARFTAVITIPNISISPSESS